MVSGSDGGGCGGGKSSGILGKYYGLSLLFGGLVDLGMFG